MSVHYFRFLTPPSSEQVFTTGMVSYPETLTDPSYEGQILVLTYPLIGNYGVPDRNIVDELGLPAFFESNRIHVSGLVVQEYSGDYSHWNADSSLSAWLKEQGIPAITGIDTRALTKRIRDHGVMLGRIEVGGEGAELEMVDPNLRNLSAEVCVPEPVIYGKGNPHKVLAVDCGIKNHMIRMFVRAGAEVKVVPWDHDLTSERDWYDGLFISNGPGDPAQLGATVDNIRELIDDPSHDSPLFGICMGNLLVGKAAGAPSFKLPFGNRGQNQPVLNTQTNEVFITTQNHGYAINGRALPAEWEQLFINCNDDTNEGIIHRTKPYFTAQFHPEAKGGPEDTGFMFEAFLRSIKSMSKERVVFHTGRGSVAAPPSKSERGGVSSAGLYGMDRAAAKTRARVRKVLVLGSGGLSIGQAGEFDYSGSQAIKALKEQNVETVLINPNIASVQTNEVDHRSTYQADHVYFLPLTASYVEQVIAKELPDGIIVSMGGQTALNLGVALDEAGVFERHDVRVLGSPVSTIRTAEDRDLFSAALEEIGEKMAPSVAVTSVKDAIKAAKRSDIGFPCMIRSAYALGGLGSGICKDEEELIHMATKAFSLAPQILVEKSLKGWKEVEYEVVRDAAGNCITVCNMENFDPMGIHTGESIVVAPSQTLTDEEYHMLRTTALNVVRHLGVVGECNIQYTLDPNSTDYAIIEVNPRLSRSSALASKATGYPLADIAARLALGITLPEILNAVTRSTCAFFEPSLDYVVTKVPRWDLAKFVQVNQQIGSQMKSVGEVMAIGRTFEESFQKALRMTDVGARGFEPRGDWSDRAKLEDELRRPTPQRPYALAHALMVEGMSVQELHELTDIDEWFLQRLENIARGAAEVKSRGYTALSDVELRRVKQLGFSDKQVALLAAESGAESAGAADEFAVRERRKSMGIVPYVKQIDTLAAEYPASTNYLYTTYNASAHDVEKGSDQGKSAMVLGSGTYRIGSSVEFDWCSVSAARTLRTLGYRTVVVNYNPETVSTDYDESDRLYFEELSAERVMDIYDYENPKGVIVSVGGQIPNTIALPMHRNGVRILGTSPEMIDSAEDRHKFSKLVDSLDIDQPAWQDLTTVEDAQAFASRVGYPVLVRPSYVLSGAAMNVCHTPEELADMLNQAADVSPDHPVLVTKFANNSMEIEFDGVASGGKVVAHAVSEHVEMAGVHSGDATLVLPPQTLHPYYIERVRDIAGRIAEGLRITGPFNMQLLASGASVSVIECNLRASRSMPFVSKTINCDLIEVATKAMVGEPLGDPRDLPGLDSAPRPETYVGVKSPMFSFTRLSGADPVLSVEMASTGEVACYGNTFEEAMVKSMMASNFRFPKRNILVSGPADALHDVAPALHDLVGMGYKLHAVGDSYLFLQRARIPAERLDPPNHKSQFSADKQVKEHTIDLVVNLHTPETTDDEGEYVVRRAAVDFGVPTLLNTKLVNGVARALKELGRNCEPKLQPLSMREYYEQEAAHQRDKLGISAGEASNLPEDRSGPVY